ncbi:hypothetical protein A2263_00205 [Candidatus Peregrinibacteria bacterium RIFOXYA2_FULL_33_21]|nr:MAG: hypothetical protein A2263_00205 [Candidatus Peregrinibacteria bacterium RIFOXYA2_FULL_33_21]
MFGIDETFYRSLGYDGGHRGVDFNVPIGTAVKSVADGVVSEVGYQEKGYGYYIKIKHKIGDRYFETIYAHGKEKSNLKVGDTVKQGNLIMLSGDTGIGGAHLHFGLRLLNKNGNVINESDIHKGYIDPISWFKSYSGQATEVNGLWPDWVNKELTWALDRNIISPDSIMQIIASTAVKYTMLEILFNFQKIIKDSKTITNRKILGEWPIWAADAVNWGINKGIVNEKSVMSAVDNESFKYTFITMLYKYYLNVLNGSAFAGKIIDGSWPDWADTAVSWAINNGLIDSKESVMQAVSSDAMKYTAIKMLYRFSNI